MGWTFYNSSGQRLSTAATSIDVLDIDGATDIGAAIVDADLFIIDDGAGGTNRKTAASRIKTYVGGLSSTVTAETRAAATASGAVSYTGAGFTPTTIIVSSLGDDGKDSYALGFGDDALGEQITLIYALDGTPLNAQIAYVAFGIDSAGSDYQRAVLTSLDSDGCTLTWTKGGSGEAVNFAILYLR